MAKNHGKDVEQETKQNLEEFQRLVATFVRSVCHATSFMFCNTALCVLYLTLATWSKIVIKNVKGVSDNSPVEIWTLDGGPNGKTQSESVCITYWSNAVGLPKHFSIRLPDCFHLMALTTIAQHSSASVCELNQNDWHYLFIEEDVMK